MRAFKLISRRTFLGRTFFSALAFLAGWFGFSRRGHAQLDYFSGTDYVGKTRAGPYRDFYINYFKPMRRINPETWVLKVGGLCDQPRTFTLDDLLTLPAHTQVSRLKCVECWSAKARWRGFHIAELEQIVRPHPQAKGVVFRCNDTYVEHLSRESLNHERTLLAYEMNGEPLTDEHGFPLRVVVPFKYGYKNPKAILEMEYVAQSEPGTWSRIGPYSTDGTILPGYDHPLDKNKIRRRISGGEILD